MCKTRTLLQPFANFFPRTTYHVHILSKNLNFKVKHFRKQTIGMTLGLFQPSTTFRGGSTDLSSKQNPAKTNPKSKDTVHSLMREAMGGQNTFKQPKSANALEHRGVAVPQTVRQSTNTAIHFDNPGARRHFWGEVRCVWPL